MRTYVLPVVVLPATLPTSPWTRLPLGVSPSTLVTSHRLKAGRRGSSTLVSSHSSFRSSERDALDPAVGACVFLLGRHALCGTPVPGADGSGSVP